MDMNDVSAGSTPLGHVLVVDDSLISTESARQALQGDFEVDTVDSGEACLERLAAVGKFPDLILLDIEMGGIDGFETCRRLREKHDIPVIFVTSHDDLPECIKAFDSGGDDFVVKPFDPEVILRKAQRIVQYHAVKKTLAAEKDSLSSMAMGFLRNLGDTGVLLNFMRSSLGVADYDELAKRLLEATASYGVRCHVQVRHDAGSCTRTPSGSASPLEESVLEKSVAMGRIFQFSRRLVVNYQSVSILIIDLPDDEGEIGKLRDNIAILAETAEAIAETIAMRKVSAARAEALQSAVTETADTVESVRQLYAKQQADTRQSLETMIDNVEKSYFNLGLTELQEARVSNILHEGTEHTLTLFEVGIELDRRLAHILEALRPRGASAPHTEVW
jgi:CheY-like chemotaxis protein